MPPIFWVFAAIMVGFGFVVFWGAPYVPSKKKALEKALDELHPLGKRDVLVDIGSGDGIVLRAATRRGARAIGYELNPLLVLISRWLSKGDARVSVHMANFWLVKLPIDTTVVYVFTVTRDVAKLVRKMNAEAARLNRPLKLISYGCEIPGYRSLGTIGAHNLYEFTPLHNEKA